MLNSDSLEHSLRLSFVQKAILLFIVFLGVASLPGLYVLTEGSLPIIENTQAKIPRKTSKPDKNSSNKITSRSGVMTVSEVEPVRTPDPSELPRTPFSLTGPYDSSGININEAPASVLEMLPGVGPKTARDIVNYRDRYGAFSDLKELDKIPGIGPATIDKISKEASL